MNRTIRWASAIILCLISAMEISMGTAFHNVAGTFLGILTAFVASAVIVLDHEARGRGE